MWYTGTRCAFPRSPRRRSTSSCGSGRAAPTATTTSSPCWSRSTWPTGWTFASRHARGRSPARWRGDRSSMARRTSPRARLRSSGNGSRWTAGSRSGSRSGSPSPPGSAADPPTPPRCSGSSPARSASATGVRWRRSRSLSARMSRSSSAQDPRGGEAAGSGSPLRASRRSTSCCCTRPIPRSPSGRAKRTRGSTTRAAACGRPCHGAAAVTGRPCSGMTSKSLAWHGARSSAPH